jgi:hypothetical protein
LEAEIRPVPHPQRPDAERSRMALPLPMVPDAEEPEMGSRRNRRWGLTQHGEGNNDWTSVARKAEMTMCATEKSRGTYVFFLWPWSA